MKVLVGRTRGIAVLDLLICPRLSAIGSGRFGVLLTLLGPGDCETCVQDATGNSVDAVASIVDSGEIASSAGGSSCDTKSWLIAP